MHSLPWGKWASEEMTKIGQEKGFRTQPHLLVGPRVQISWNLDKNKHKALCSSVQRWPPHRSHHQGRVLTGDRRSFRNPPSPGVQSLNPEASVTCPSVHISNCNLEEGKQKPSQGRFRHPANPHVHIENQGWGFPEGGWLLLAMDNGTFCDSRSPLCQHQHCAVLGMG